MFKLLILSILISPPAPYISCEGEFQQGGLYLCSTSNDYYVKDVFHDGKKIPSYNGKFLIGFGRDAKEETNLSLMHTSSESPYYERNFKVAQREYQTQHINNLDKSKVNPPKMDWDRIKRENAKIAAIRKNYSKECPENLNFIKPTEGQVTGVYGSQRILNGEPKRPHFGIDYAAPLGTEIVSPADGKVTLTHNDMFYTGGTIGIDHGCGLVSIFSHLNSVDITEGSVVKQGDEIGTVGSTGRSTGPHLDWRVNLGKTRLDPALVLKYFGNE